MWKWRDPSKNGYCRRSFLKRIVVSSARDCFIELIYRDFDPASWIVRHWVKFMWFKRRISSSWFNDEQQALAFANEIKRKHEGH